MDAERPSAILFCSAADCLSGVLHGALRTSSNCRSRSRLEAISRSASRRAKKRRNEPSSARRSSITSRRSASQRVVAIQPPRGFIRRPSFPFAALAFHDRVNDRCRRRLTVPQERRAVRQLDRRSVGCPTDRASQPVRHMLCGAADPAQRRGGGSIGPFSPFRGSFFPLLRRVPSSVIFVRKSMLSYLNNFVKCL